MNGIVLLTGGHTDCSLCYVLLDPAPFFDAEGNWQRVPTAADLCQQTATRYVRVDDTAGSFARTTLTHVCDEHHDQVTRLPGFRWSTPSNTDGRVVS